MFANSISVPTVGHARPTPIEECVLFQQRSVSWALETEEITVTDLAFDPFSGLKVTIPP
ncbi:MAG: hypothetical protein QOH90_2095, partial [Actinomycetota bacterium]|nr:hypothetical protein [Actinomycetota bacterium]